MAYMIDKNASSRYQIGDSVEWVSGSGNQYTGQIVRIREARAVAAADVAAIRKGALITVRIEGGAYRNFYENQVEHHLQPDDHERWIRSIAWRQDCPW